MSWKRAALADVETNKPCNITEKLFCGVFENSVLYLESVKLIENLFFFSSPIQDLSLPNGTPVDTSSPASSSSLLNRLQLDDDFDVETRDLFVTVDDPKKHVCTMETYITYRVTTKVQSNILFPSTFFFVE